MDQWLFVLVLATLFNSSIQQASRIRLVGGSGPHEGRVEVRPSNSYNWGTVCDDSFGLNDARVACRMLGYSGALSYRPSAYYGQGSGKNIYMDELGCSGTESSLFSCPYRGWGVHDCSHTEDVGVLCYPAPDPTPRPDNVQSQRMTTYTMTGQLRYGRPVYKSSRNDYLFFYQSDDSWHVGPQLGTDYIGMYVDDISINAEDISGTWYLFDGTNFTPYISVRVTCANVNIRVRLVGGSGPQEGRVEVRLSNSYTWGTVCDDRFGMNDAGVVCRMLGYSGASAYHGSAHYGRGSGSIYMDELGCSGTESNLITCPYRGWGVHNCDHGDDVGVVCYSSANRTRLVGGSGPHEGRVEVRLSTGYNWGTVCDDSFGMNDAGVVCRMLGYTGASAYHGSAYYGRGSGNIYMDDLRCTGTETILFDCPYSGWGNHNCDHGDDVGVVCYSSSGVTSGLSTGAIVGISVGAVAAVVLIIVISCCCCCKKSAPVATTSPSSPPAGTANPAFTPPPAGPPPAYSPPVQPPPDGLVFVRVVRIQ
ncbi:scavenger receptor [Branchiostoma belcheri]|nr:scavenger receptor [Branchiostoma belcheri]